MVLVLPLTPVLIVVLRLGLPLVPPLLATVLLVLLMLIELLLPELLLLVEIVPLNLPQLLDQKPTSLLVPVKMLTPMLFLPLSPLVDVRLVTLALLPLLALAFPIPVHQATQSFWLLFLHYSPSFC